MFTGTGIFITSVILVSIIAMCFFKKKFWENRFIILLIIGGVALVATLITNFSIRGQLKTNIKTIWEKPIELCAFNDSLIDMNFITINNELKMSDHIVNNNDSSIIASNSHYLFYYGSGNDLKIGFMVGDEISAEYWKDVYITKSNSDKAYLSKLKEVYDSKNSHWIADISLPRIQTVKCLYLPEKEFSTIPDSLIRKLPF